ncbi:MAG TPA: hypothetical protein VM659_00550 [Dongiaceae bacterium]|nr:hypothetical protein [Dongiaceae bacterium]
MWGVSGAVLTAWFILGIFSGAQIRHTVDFRGSSESFGTFITYWSFATFVTQVGYIIYSWWAADWSVAVALVIAAIAASFSLRVIGRVVGLLPLSLGGFLVVPVCEGFIAYATWS